MPKGAKFGGRQKGSVNKNTGAIREHLKLFINNKWPEMEKSFDKLRPKDQWIMFEKLLSYVSPKLSNLTTSLSQLSEGDMQFLIETLKKQNNGKEKTN